MNSRIKLAVNTAVLASAICFTAFRANAEHLTFELPVEAKWGAAVLQPGIKYTVEIPLATSFPQQMVLTKNGSTVRILALSEESTDQSNGSYLRLVAVGDAYFVREYRSGQSGKQFTFQVPERPRHEREQMVKAPAKDIQVGVAAGS